LGAAPLLFKKELSFHIRTFPDVKMKAEVLKLTPKPKTKGTPK
jgi:hypothetical protein